MISQYFVDLFTNIVGWIAGILPNATIPDNVVHPDAAANGLFGLVTGLGVWVSWPVINACVGVSLAVFAAGGLIALFRVILSHLPYFGGR